MARYATAQQVIDRYNELDDVSSGGGFDTISSHYLPFAEAEIDSRLGSVFTTPFSSNNLTVVDLTIDTVYVKAANLKFEEREVIQKSIDARIQRLCDGKDQLLVQTDSGDIINVGAGSSVAWSNTKGYHATFGMSDIEDVEIDDTILSDEANQRA